MTKKDIRKLLLPILALTVCCIIVFFERFGVIRTDQLKDDDELVFSQAVVSQTDCLVLYDESELSVLNKDMMILVLEDMKVGYDLCQVTEFEPEQLDNYKTLVLALDDWTLLGDKIFDICVWVKNGGGMMNTMTPQPTRTYQAVCGKMGVISGGTNYASIRGIKILSGTMIGATDEITFELSDEDMYISLGVGLSDKAKVFIESSDGKVPLMWSMEYGEGCFTLINEGFMDKYKRGILCAAYSTLEDVSIYPVINGSTFYLDDFPSPVPGGDGDYIERDYGLDIGSFYSNIWWPDILHLGEKYGIRFTGVVIEQYSDEVDGTFERNELSSQFVTYGNMLLNAGGEIGFHGYNHMPLCVEGIDDERQFAEYNLWPSITHIKAAMTELLGFCSELYPGLTFKVYVPPSNIMSETGLKALREACPDITVIASTFLTDEESNVYEQEFGVDEDGVIHTPRVVSGCIMDDYIKMMVLSELNFHYVQNHFFHPDDTLDVDRGAAEGWEVMRDSLDAYMNWIYTSAPAIRNLTGSELGTAVLQYDKLSVNRQLEDDELVVQIGGFSGEAYFMMRVNNGEIGKTVNCQLEHVTGDLYLVHATNDEIRIEWIKE